MNNSRIDRFLFAYYFCHQLSPVPAFQEMARRWQEHPELLLRDSNSIVDLVSNKTNHIFIGV